MREPASHAGFSHVAARRARRERGRVLQGAPTFARLYASMHRDTDRKTLLLFAAASLACTALGIILLLRVRVNPQQTIDRWYSAIGASP
jgi:hypothetical protein